MIEKREYIVTPLEKIKLSPDDLLSHQFDEEIKERMLKVNQIEGPICEHLLFKRVLNSFSLEKLGSRLEPLFLSLISTLSINNYLEDNEKIYYPSNIILSSFFRPCSEKERYSYQIPYSEAAAVIVYILENSNKSFYKGKLLDSFAFELNYQRKGAQVVKLFESSLEYAIANNMIKESGNHKILL